jgi:hypothetical protein
MTSPDPEPAPVSEETDGDGATEFLIRKFHLRERMMLPEVQEAVSKILREAAAARRRASRTTNDPPAAPGIVWVGRP